MKTCCSPKITGLSRREAFGLIALGGGVSLLSTLAPSVTWARGHTDMLLLTCMDYRLNSEIDDYMTARGLKHKFDHVVLATEYIGPMSKK